VGDVATDRVALVVLENRRVCRRLALDDDVEHGVQPRVGIEGGSQRAFLDHDRARARLAVEHAGNEPLLAQTPRLGRAEQFAFLYLESKSVAGHGGGL
jgi:hypothetical protein